MYEDLLMNDLIFSAVFMGIMLLIVIAMTVFVFVMRLPKAPKIVSIGMILFLLVASICDMTPLILDVREDAYVTYTGEFTVEKANHYKDGERKAELTFSDYHRTLFVVKDAEELAPATYYGTIVYAKHSKIVFEWSVQSE